MIIVNNKYCKEIRGEDNYGEFTLRIQNDFSQLALETSNGDSYINIDKSELEKIRDTLSKMIEESK